MHLNFFLCCSFYQRLITTGFVTVFFILCCTEVPRLVETRLWLVKLEHVLAIWLLSSKVKFEPCTGCWSEIWNVLFIIVEGTRYRHTVIGTVWFRCPKKFKSKFIQYIIIINYYYSLVDACCYYEMRVTQELTTDIHTVTRTVWFYCPKKFKSKFIHYIIIENYYYSLVDACCYYEMRVTS